MSRKRTTAMTAIAAFAALTAATALSGPATAAGAQPLTAAEVSALTIAPGNASTSVIVLLRNQPGAAARGSAAALSRAQAIAGNQAPLVSELTQVHAKNLRRYQLINAVAATVSAAEATRLAANPNVAQVLPDRLLKVAQPAKTPSRKAGSASGTVPAGTCAPAGQTQLEPEGLSTTNTDSADPAARKTARSLGFTGAGVKVGFIAEGIDVNNPDFIRADGSKVFANFQDFSGEGAAAPNVDSESFLDASAIAAQGRQVYDVQNFSADPLPSTCDIRVEGVSPGVSLFGYKVLGTNAEFSEANYIQAIDYAVTTDHVDVLNESVVFQPVPGRGRAQRGGTGQRRCRTRRCHHCRRDRRRGHQQHHRRALHRPEHHFGGRQHRLSLAGTDQLHRRAAVFHRLAEQQRLGDHFGRLHPVWSYSRPAGTWGRLLRGVYAKSGDLPGLR